MKTYALALLLAGCSGPFYYESDCIQFDSEVALDPNKVPIYTAKAKEIFDRQFGEGSMCNTLKNNSVVKVRDSVYWECLGSGPCIGMTDTWGNVEVNRGGVALLHEFIHVYERNAGVPPNMNHKDWDIKGYYDISNEFGRYVTSPEVGTWITFFRIKP